MVLLYSMEWGKQKSEEWLSTFLLSMIQSAVVVDPILVRFGATTLTSGPKYCTYAVCVYG